LTIKEIIKASNGILINGDSERNIKSYKIDSREVIENDFFIPIVGEKNDAHKYIEELVKFGISGYFIESNNINKHVIIENTININKDICIIEINNSIEALYNIAKYNRYIHSKIPIVAVTGSVGKTSTKEMISSVLSTENNVLKTEKNYNGYIGLSLMLLKLDNQDIAVLEHGIDSIGEMDNLVDASIPDFAVITNIGISHIEKLGSRENIFNEKIKISKNMNKNNILLLNKNDEFLFNYNNSNINIEYFSANDISDLIINDNISFNTKIYDTNESIVINELGMHNVVNALCAIKIGEIFKISKINIIKGISLYKNFERRFQKINLKNNITLIDDSYNSSVDSVLSGLISIKNINSKRKIIVLGDMLELGDFSKDYHLLISDKIEKDYIVILIGKDVKSIYDNLYGCKNDIYYFDNINDGINTINSILKADDLIYLKASNGMNFKKIADSIILDKGLLK
jgi:UDP-N-acetylmuramoyl-tripeptide--D-alanyl-D-alanine ligase